MNRLTTIIPTFDRPELLKSQVARLLPQLNPNSLIVIDNASNTNLKDILPDNIRYGRNSINISGVGNILRCFEVCETEWLWICGDDDPVLNDSIDKIESLIQQFSDTCFISTSSSLVSHPSSLKVNNVIDFVNNFHLLIDHVG